MTLWIEITDDDDEKEIYSTLYNEGLEEAEKSQDDHHLKLDEIESRLGLEEGELDAYR